MRTNNPSITVGKLEVARRQLATAIDLWFGGGDPVSIHTLAYAAYEIIHFVSKKRNPNRRDLLFDTDLIKDEHRKDFAVLIKKEANFFKHAKEDADKTIEFRPALTDFYLLFAVIGVRLCGEKIGPAELSFVFWLQLHRPELLTKDGQKRLIDSIPVESRGYLKSIPKQEFPKHVEMMLRAANDQWH